MSDNSHVPPQLHQAISDRINGMEVSRREQFASAMNKLSSHMASMTAEEREAFAVGIADLHRKTQNGEELSEEDLEAVSGGVAWGAIGAWVVENLDWQEFKKGIVDAWNET